MKVKVVNKSNHRLPGYKYPGDAGMDLYALDDYTIHPGLHTLLPEGYELQIRPRSGLALKDGISCLNTPGTIDQSYTGDIGVILINLGQNNFIVNPGDRIAQAVLNKFEKIEWDEVSSLDATERSDNGFGSTGK